MRVSLVRQRVFAHAGRMPYRPFRPARQLSPALGALARIETTSAVLPPPRYGLLREGARRVRRVGAAEVGIPDDGAPLTRRPMVARVAADHVVLAKMSTAEELRFRAFYLRGSVPMTLKAAREIEDVASRIQRELTARQALPKLRRLRVPRILDHGDAGRLEYLVEELIPGRVLAPTDRPAHLDDVLSGLTEMYEATAAPPATIGLASSAAWDRAVAFIDSAKWARGWLPRRQLLGELTALVEADPPMATAMGHGDLVWSNILVGTDGVGLVDWEWAGPRPIAQDMVKLMTSIPGRFSYLPRLDQLSRDLGVDTPFAAQWALATVKSLASAAHRLRTATAAGRGDIQSGRARQQIGILGQLLQSAEPV